MLDRRFIYFFKILLLGLLSCSLTLFSQETKNIDGITLRAKTKKYKSKKDNPAYPILQKLWEHKRKNGLEKFSTYQFKEYEKIEYDLSNIDSAFMKKKAFNKLGFIFKYADSADNGKLALPIFLNEAVYQNFGQNIPSKKSNRVIIAQKTSGFQDNQLITEPAKNLYKEFNIYDNTINFFNIGFASPAGSSGFSTYDYALTDSLTIRGEKAYRISFQPKRPIDFAFQGTLYVSADKFALIRVIMRTNSKLPVNFVNSIYTNLEFENPDEETFLPKNTKIQFELSFASKKKEAKGIIAKRSVDYTDYILNQPIEQRNLEINETVARSKELEKNDDFWDKARTDSLSKTEKGVYEMLDQLNRTPKFKNTVKLVETLGSGYYNIGNAFDFGSIYYIYGYNNIEGNRIRLGGRTYFGQNDTWRIQGYGAYGFKDEKFKYGIEGKILVNKKYRVLLGAGSRSDIMQLGSQPLTSDENLLVRTNGSSLIFSRGENNSLSNITQQSVFGSFEPWENFQFRIDGSLESITSADQKLFNTYYYLDGNLRKTVNDSHIAASIVWRPGAKFMKSGIARYQQGTLSPTFILKYTRGIQGLFNADFGYNKLQFLYKEPFIFGNWGKSIVNVEGSKNFETLPLALQNVIPGNQSYGLSIGTFSQMNYYEFVTDQYYAGMWEHHFYGKLLSYVPLIKKLKLREVGFIRAAYGTLSAESKNINQQGWKYSAPDQQIYFEYGFGLENIGFGNFKIIRVDFNWRGNYLDRPNVSRFGIKAGFQLAF